MRSLERTSVFFQKKTSNYFEAANRGLFYEEFVSNGFFAQSSRNNRSLRFYGGESMVFSRKKSPSKDSNSLNLAKFAWDASRKVELRKNSHYFIFWVFIWKNRGIFSRKKFKKFYFFQSPKLGLSYLESVTKITFVLDYSKLSMSGTLCRNIELFWRKNPWRF